MLSSIFQCIIMPTSNFPKPERIYKYTSLETANFILSNQTLKFSRPAEFNDPFDCDVSLLDFEIKGEVPEHVAFEMEKIKEQYGDIPAFQEMSSKEGFWEDLYRKSQISKVNSSRICCFSLSNDIVLMWSHYSDKHTGVCLEFDNKIEKRFLNLNEKKDISEGVIGYSAHERINYLGEERYLGIYKLFFNKSESWSHEKEYRLALLHDKAEYQEFSSSFLKAVYFGVNSNEDSMAHLITICQKSNLKNVAFYRCNKANLMISFSKIA